MSVGSSGRARSARVPFLAAAALLTVAAEEARTAARARAEELAAQDLDRARLNRLADDLAAFASTVRAGLEQLDFAAASA